MTRLISEPVRFCWHHTLPSSSLQCVANFTWIVRTPPEQHLDFAGIIALSASQPTISQTFLRPATARPQGTAAVAPQQGPDVINAAAAAVNTPGTRFTLSSLSEWWTMQHRRQRQCLVSNVRLTSAHSVHSSTHLRCIRPCAENQMCSQDRHKQEPPFELAVLFDRSPHGKRRACCRRAWCGLGGV